ncbi:MAG: hypothetical protein P9L99_11910 [Candidatus Lernaella stagnicola]|nr:hypothetical protein [Candidatus Lernaella stagnicola]
MSETGKNYRKGDPVRGAAILMLSCERRGITGQAARDLVQGIIGDLGIKEAQVRRYLRKHRDELLAVLENQVEA